MSSSGSSAVAPALRSLSSPPPLGVRRQTLKCWEYGALVFGADQESATESMDGAHQIQLVSASWGDPENEKYREDITRQVHEFFEQEFSAEYAIGAVPELRRIEVPALTRVWGDPARFRMKQLAITYEYVWLDRAERAALEALERRVSEKAQSAVDLEELLQRLGNALLGAAGGPASAGARRPVSLEPSSPPPAAHGTSASSPSPEKPPVSAPLGSTSPRWRQLGFQSSNPRTDLRTGRLALEALVYLAEKYPMETGLMVREAQSDGIDYPFAVASINITQQLARYLGLAGEGAVCGEGSRKNAAPLRVVRRFAHMLIDADTNNSAVDPFGELHVAVMERLHAAWRARKRDDPTLTVMDFSPALDETLAALHAFLLGAELNSPAEFRSLPGPGEFAGFYSVADAVAAAGLAGAEAAEAAEARAAAAHAEAVGRRRQDPTTRGMDQSREDSSYDMIQQAASTASETAAMFGTYLQGFISDTFVVTSAATSSTATPGEADGNGGDHSRDLEPMSASQC